MLVGCAAAVVDEVGFSTGRLMLLDGAAFGLEEASAVWDAFEFGAPLA